MASPATGPAEAFDAVVLAGGGSTRLGGRDKARLLLDGVRLVDRAVAAARAAGAVRCVVAGPASLQVAVPTVSETPPAGGPVAGVAAALEVLGREQRPAPWLLVLPCDLVEPDGAVTALLAARPERGDGVHLLDAGGRSQWLTGCYRTAALRAALARLGEATGRSARELLTGCAITGVVAPEAAADIDTWEDLGRARARSAKEAP